MNRVPSYQVVEFLSWLSNQRQRSLVGAIERPNELIELATTYLSGQRKFASLTLMLEVFQTCPMIREPDLLSQMRHFVTCGECIDLTGFEPLGRRELHPLLRSFITWLAARNLLSERIVVLPQPDSRASSWLKTLVKLEAPDLVQAFEAYLDEADQALVRDFWQRRIAAAGTAELGPLPQTEEGTQSVGLDESLEDAAARLADTTRWMSDRVLAGERFDPTILHCMARTNLAGSDVAQALEFLSWLEGRYPDLNLLGSVSTEKVFELALDFCQERQYTNAKAFAQEVTKWIRGDADPPVLERLRQIARRSRGPRKNGATSSPLSRYQAVPFHAMFLFLSVGDFDDFVRDYWRDLNALSGDWLEIYYSDNDLRQRTSGYDILKRLRSVQASFIDLPALIFWEKSLDGAQAIPLRWMTHEQIFDLLKLVVQRISEGESLGAICSEAQEVATRESERLLVATQTVIENVWQPNISGNSGMVNFGNQVTATQVRLENQQLDQALDAVRRAVVASGDLDAADKRVHIEMVDEIAKEAAKPTPSKTRLQMLGAGLWSSAKMFPTIAQTAGALCEVLSTLNPPQ